MKFGRAGRVVPNEMKFGCAGRTVPNETLAPQNRSPSPNMVNPSVPAPEVPPDSIFGRSFHDFGQDVIRWGTGEEGGAGQNAGRHLGGGLTQDGVNPAQAQAARDFYAGVLARNPGNAAAVARVQLMDHILQLLGGQ